MNKIDIYDLCTVVAPDVTTDGEPCYMASHPDLEGCMAHGDTPEEALNNLREATALYLSHIGKVCSA